MICKQNIIYVSLFAYKEYNLTLVCPSPCELGSTGDTSLPKGRLLYQWIHYTHFITKIKSNIQSLLSSYFSIMKQHFLPIIRLWMSSILCLIGLSTASAQILPWYQLGEQMWSERVASPFYVDPSQQWSKRFPVTYINEVAWAPMIVATTGDLIYIPHPRLTTGMLVYVVNRDETYRLTRKPPMIENSTAPQTQMSDWTLVGSLSYGSGGWPLRWSGGNLYITNQSWDNTIQLTSGSILLWGTIWGNWSGWRWESEWIWHIKNTNTWIVIIGNAWQPTNNTFNLNIFGGIFSQWLLQFTSIGTTLSGLSAIITSHGSAAWVGVSTLPFCQTWYNNESYGPADAPSSANALYNANPTIKTAIVNSLWYQSCDNPNLAVGTQCLVITFNNWNLPGGYTSIGHPAWNPIGLAPGSQCMTRTWAVITVWPVPGSSAGVDKFGNPITVPWSINSTFMGISWFREFTFARNIVVWGSPINYFSTPTATSILIGAANTTNTINGNQTIINGNQTTVNTNNTNINSIFNLNWLLIASGRRIDINTANWAWPIGMSIIDSSWMTYNVEKLNWNGQPFDWDNDPNILYGDQTPCNGQFANWLSSNQSSIPWNHLQFRRVEGNTKWNAFFCGDNWLRTPLTYSANTSRPRPIYRITPTNVRQKNLLITGNIKATSMTLDNNFRISADKSWGNVLTIWRLESPNNTFGPSTDNGLELSRDGNLEINGNTLMQWQLSIPNLQTNNYWNLPSLPDTTTNRITSLNINSNGVVSYWRRNIKIINSTIWTIQGGGRSPSHNMWRTINDWYCYLSQFITRRWDDDWNTREHGLSVRLDTNGWRQLSAYNNRGRLMDYTVMCVSR